MAKTITAPMGVCAGYDSFSDEVKPNDARSYVREKIKKIKGKDFGVFAGVAVYPKVYGCPDGGEPLGFIIASPQDEEKSRDTLLYLQKKFKQEEVYVATTRQNDVRFDDAVGMLSQGYAPDVELYDVAELWQEKASKLEKAGNPYVSTVIHKDDNGHLFFQAECNPYIYDDETKWKKTAKECLRQVSEEIGVQIEPHFRRTDLNFSLLDRASDALDRLRKKLNIGKKVEKEMVPLNEAKAVNSLLKPMVKE